MRWKLLFVLKRHQYKKYIVLLFTSQNMIKKDNKLSVRRKCELLGNQPV